MRSNLIAASLLALGLFAATAVAQDQPKDIGAPQQEQPPAQEAPGAEAAPAVETPAALPPEVMALLGDSRPASELSADELKARFSQARQFSRMEGISPDIQQQLAAMAKDARGELAAREQQAQPAEQPAAKAEEPAQQPAAKAEEPAQKAKRSSGEGLDSTGGGAIPPAVVEMLGDNRPASSLNDEQLERRLSRLRKFEGMDSLPPDAANQLRAMRGEAEQELVQRQQAQSQPAPAPQPEAAPQPPVADAPPPPPQPGAPPQPPKPPVAEAPAPQLAPVAPPPAADKGDVQQLDANQANPETERRAKDLMVDADTLQRWSDDDLRQHLDQVRSVLATNELSPGMERELRRQLNTEREILRDRVAAVEADRLRKEQKKQRPQNRYWSEEAPSDWDWSARDALNDRRRSEDLQTYELRRRIEIYRQATADKRYAPDYREYWRAVIARDQYVLQLRLVELRRKRQAQIDDVYDESSLDFEIGIGRAPDEDVFAAEVDDEQLQDVLIAKPRRKFNRRFTIEEIEQNEEVRAALPRVEVDTVRFGFNEAFVRPEEIDKLDRIGEILERILRKNPNEIFLIEGHTDAVGSDAANLALSRKRAEAVKKALTTYYIIPSRALRTVGYGERYLKIPTAEAEGENRRVSVGRATDVIGQLQ